MTRGRAIRVNHHRPLVLAPPATRCTCHRWPLAIEGRYVSTCRLPGHWFLPLPWGLT